MKFLSLAAWAVAAAASPICHKDEATVGTRQAGLPTKFSWSASQPYISAKADSHHLDGMKDPSVIFHGGKYHVFASAAKASGYNLVYLSFTDWAQAQSATFYYLDQTPIGPGYRAAPQIHWNTAMKKWFLLYQCGGPCYSTNADINKPGDWTAPQPMYPATPAALERTQCNWVDMWVICDSALCHLFSSCDNGDLLRSQTTVANFPHGMSEPVVSLHEANKFDNFEASNVYNVGGGQYMLVVEAAGHQDGYRYFRSWYSHSLSGKWVSLANTEANPFIRSNNVQFKNGNAWTKAFSHGEVVRHNVDETMTISPCGMQYLFQGVDPKVAVAGANYDGLSWKLGLLTQVGC